MSPSDLYLGGESHWSDLTTALAHSLGPTARPVMITQKSPRSVAITKLGTDILRSFAGTHPLLDVAVSHVSGHVASHGDGAKRCFLMAAAFLRRLRRAEVGARPRLRADLARVRTEVLPAMEQEWRTGEGRRVKRTPVGDSTPCANVLRRVAASFFASRFSLGTAEILTDLVIKYLEKMGADQDLTTCLRDCSRSSSGRHCIEAFHVPASESSLEAGFLLRGRLIQEGREGKAPAPAHAKFMVWSRPEHRREETKAGLRMDSEGGGGRGESESEEKKTEGKQQEVRYSQFYGKLLDMQSHRMERFLLAVKDVGVTLLVCAFCLPEFVRFLCLRHGLEVVEGVPIEEAQDLATEAGISLWTGDDNGGSSSEDFCESMHAGNLLEEGLTPVLVAGSQYFRLHLNTGKPVYHAVVCAPTKDLARQYSSCVVECIRVLSLCYDDEGGKHFLTISQAAERQIAMDLMERIDSASLSLDESVTGLKAMLAETVNVRSQLDDSSETPLALIFRIYETALCTLERVLSIEQICSSGKRIAKYLGKKQNGRLCAFDSDTD